MHGAPHPAGKAGTAAAFETRIPARLDRLPWSRFHWLVVALGITWILDGLEVTLVGSLAGAIKQGSTLSLSDTEIGAAASCNLVGAIMGALGFGVMLQLLPGAPARWQKLPCAPGRAESKIAGIRDSRARYGICCSLDRGNGSLPVPPKARGAGSLIGRARTMHQAVAKPAEPAQILKTAFVLHQQGKKDEAAELYRLLLRDDPEQPRALMLLGMLLADRGDFAGAEELFRRYLGLAPDEPVAYVGIAPVAVSRHGESRAAGHVRLEKAIVLFELGKIAQRQGADGDAILLFERALAYKPDYAAAFNDLGVSLHRKGRLALALAVFDRAVALDPRFAVAHRNRGFLLLELHRQHEAAAAFLAVVELLPDSPDGWYDLGGAYEAAEMTAEAEAAFRRVIALEPRHIEARLQLALTLEHAHRHDEARRLRIEAARLHGVVTTPCAGGPAQARVLVIGGAANCNASLKFLLPRNRYATVSTYLPPPDAAEEGDAGLAARLPEFDLVFNAISDADRGELFLEPAARLCAEAGRPVINPPDRRISRTRRDLIPALLADIPGLVVPATRRAGRAELLAMAEADLPLQRPALLRPVGAHGGEELVRFQRCADFRPYLDSIPDQEFYLSEFWDYAGADGYFRKYRLIFVDRAVHPYHLVVGHDWLLHYFRVDMRAQSWMKPAEEAFLADWESVFDGVRGEAVREVARRLDLDYAGIDCSLLPDGRVLLFEANATMLVHLHDPVEEYPYKHRYVPRIVDAVGDMIARRIAAPR